MKSTASKGFALGRSIQNMRRLFVKNFRRITITYVLSILENFFNLLYPFVTGRAIDGLLTDHSYFWLGVFSTTWVAHTVTGVLRQRYDTAVFTGIYSQLATDMVQTQHKQEVSTSQIVARSALMREIVDFFEHHIPQIIGLLFGFFGSLAMLFWYDLQIGLVCLAVLVPMCIFNFRYLHRSVTLNRQLNDQLEKEAEIIATGDAAAVANHYLQVAKWRKQLSNAEANNWGVLESFLILVTTFVIVRAAQLSTRQEAGTVYATIAYLWSYCESLGHVPALIQQMSRLKDINDRIDLEAGGSKG